MVVYRASEHQEHRARMWGRRTPPALRGQSDGIWYALLMLSKAKLRQRTVSIHALACEA